MTLAGRCELTVRLLGDDALYDEDAAFGGALADGLDGIVGGGIPPFAGFACAVEGDYYQAAFWGFALERLELPAADYIVVIEGRERCRDLRSVFLDARGIGDFYCCNYVGGRGFGLLGVDCAGGG